jgi:tetratricopeptide (TPR) repeat protein
VKKDLLLNNIFLKNRLAEEGIKQWWLAEQVGVDRKTVTRWIQGQVKSIQPENAEALCRILKCDVNQLCLQSEADQLATAEDQKAAAELLTQSSLIDKLGPIGEWNVIESLLKAILLPNLPLDVLGQLYNQLTVASWRQSKIDQAEIYNKKALDIADKLQDKTIKAQALLSRGNIFSWRGQISKSIETYKSALQYSKFIEPKTVAATYSNLGAVFYESGQLNLAEEFERKSIELFHFHGTPVNLSISFGHLARIYLLKKDYENAKSCTEKSISFATQDNYRRGLCLGSLLLSEVSARKNEFTQAKKYLEDALAGYQDLKIEEGLNYEFAGRISRLIGDLENSKAYLEKGITLSQDFPIELAGVYAELALTLKALKQNPEAALKNAIAIYTTCECPLKVQELQSIKF